MSTQLQALGQVLHATHAAIWAYGQIGAVISEQYLSRVQQHDQRHRAQRAMLEDAIRDRAGTPAASAAAYQLDSAPQDDSSAVLLAADVEDSMASQWRYCAVLAESIELRQWCLDQLQHSAAEALTWRRLLDANAAPNPFPGLA